MAGWLAGWPAGWLENLILMKTQSSAQTWTSTLDFDLGFVNYKIMVDFHLLFLNQNIQPQLHHSSGKCSLGLIPWASKMQRMISVHMPKLRPLDAPLKLSHGTTDGQPCGGLPSPYFCFFAGPKPKKDKQAGAEQCLAQHLL